MGADEKHAATYHDGQYTPTTESVRQEYRNGRKFGELYSKTDFSAEFDRWLETVRAEAKAEALEDFAKVIDAEESDQWIQDGIRRPGAQIVAGRMKVLGKVARNRANHYKENQ